MGRVFKFPKTEFQYSGVVSSGSAVYIDTFPEQEGALTYDGTEQMPIWKNLDLMKLLIDGELSAVSAGVHYVTVTPVGNFRWPDKTQTPRQVPYLIKRKPIEKQPTLAAELTFNGLEQTPLWNDFDAEIMTVGGVCQNQIDAGTYTATFTPDSNHCWKDGSYTPIEVEWKINVLELTKPTASASSLTWNNATQNLTLANFNETFMTKAGTLSAKDVGNYSATVELISDTNTRWKDGSIEPIEITWQIKKLAIAKPTTNNANLTFAERWQEPTWVNYNATYMTKTGGTLYNVGDSTTTVFALKDTVNSSWAGGSTANVSIPWKIATKRTITTPTWSNTSLTYNTATQNATFANYNTTYMTISGTTSAKDGGDYTATFTLKDSKNNQFAGGAASVNVAWKIAAREVHVRWLASAKTVEDTSETLVSGGHPKALQLTDASFNGKYQMDTAVYNEVVKYLQSDNALFKLGTEWTVNYYTKNEKLSSVNIYLYSLNYNDKNWLVLNYPAEAVLIWINDEAHYHKSPARIKVQYAIILGG